jgi:hypothetical protein
MEVTHMICSKCRDQGVLTWECRVCSPQLLKPEVHCSHVPVCPTCMSDIHRVIAWDEKHLEGLIRTFEGQCKLHSIKGKPDATHRGIAFQYQGYDLVIGYAWYMIEFMLTTPRFRDWAERNPRLVSRWTKARNL